MRIYSGTNFKQLICDAVQFLACVTLCAYVSPFIGVFVAMIRFEVR